MTPVWVFLALVVVWTVVLLLLRVVNLPRQHRHLQVWSPMAALAAGIVVVGLIRLLQVPVGAVAGPLATLLQRVPALSRWVSGGVVDVAANLILAGGFLALKSGVNGMLLGIARFRPQLLTRISPAHRLDLDHGVVIRDEWVFPGMVMRRVALLAGIPLLLLMLDQATIALLPAVPLGMPVLPLLLLLEGGWYLDGMRPAAGNEAFGGADVTTRAVGDYEPLWEQYQETWPDRVLAAARLHSSQPVARRSAESLPNPERAELPAQIWQQLAASGHRLSHKHYEVLQALHAGHDVLLHGVVYEAFAPVILSILHLRMIDGQRVLVLVDADRHASPGRQDEAAQWVRNGLARLPSGDAAWVVETADEFRRGPARTNVLVGSTHEILEYGLVRDQWFSQVSTVLVLNASATLMGHLPSARALVQVLKDGNGAVQLVVASDERTGLESGMRDAFSGEFREFSLAGAMPRDAFAIVWQLEGQMPFQQPIVGGVDYLGAEPVLAIPAWRANINRILPVHQEEQPWDEFVQELAQHEVLRAEGLHSRHLGESTPAWLVSPQERAFVLARDREHNLAAVLRELLPLGEAASFVHVVSPPYLLRDYFADNIEYFLSDRDPPRALTPRVADTSPYAVAYTLLERLLAGELIETEIQAALRAVDRADRIVEEALRELFLHYLQLDLGSHGGLLVETRREFSEHLNDFREVVYFRLAESVRHRLPEWLLPFEVRDSGGNLQGFVRADHLYQTFMPGQTYTFRSRDTAGHADKPYAILGIDAGNRRVRTDHVRPPDHVGRRAHRRVRLERLELEHPLDRRGPRQSGGIETTVSHCTASYVVETLGCFRFPVAMDIRSALRETPSAPVPQRTYEHGRAFHLRVTGDEGRLGGAPHDLARTLAVLLNECFPTLFPETHTLLLACALPAQTPDDTLEHVLPALMTEGVDIRSEAGTIELVVLEDSHADIGLTRCLLEEWEHVLQLIEDYLTWVLTPQSADQTDAVGPQVWRKSGTRTFLQYGADVLPDGVDLEGTRRLLEAVLGGRNPIRAQRTAFYSGAGPRYDGLPPGCRRCDLCGGVVPETHFQRLADGRERCNDCAEAAVDTIPELQAVYREARDFLERDLGVRDITRDIRIDFAGADEIAAAQGRTFMPTADFDRRAIGLAIGGPGGFRILVENGAPHHMTLETVVHELTHIWQFSRLDHAKMRAEHGLLLIEGHAQWAGLTCLERRGLAPEYRVREAARSDVYGQGYRMMLQLLTRHQSANAFDVIRRTYGV